MKKVDLFIIRSYLGPLILTFFIALFILLMQFLWLYVDDLVGKGLEWHVLLRLLFYASSTFVPMALPLAILLSSLMTFGNLGEHYELVALKASGISLKRIMKPLIILSIFISGLAFLFSNNVLPVANLKFRSLLYDVQQKKLAFKIKEGIFNKDLGDYTLRIGGRAEDGETIYDVMIYDHSGRNGNTKVSVAESGTMKQSLSGDAIEFTLFNGYNYEEKTDQKNYRVTRPFQTTQFSEERIRFTIDNGLSRTDENLFKHSYHMMDLSQLTKSKDSLNILLKRRNTDFGQNLIRKYKNYHRVDSLKLNKQLYSDTLMVSEYTSILFDLHVLDRNKIIESALNRTRNIKESVVGMNDENTNRENTIRKHDIAYHKKFTLSIACLILFFVGAPLGAIIRKGGLGLPVVMSTLFFIAYHILTMTGERAVKAGSMNLWIGVWMASAIFLPIGIFLTLKATSDAPLFDADTYKKMFEKIFKRKESKSIQ
ncbi:MULTISPECIES: LptF/LptG family permease [unclassified Lentimicrobium]|uniref:LptF/LptG family permease n=1 Tax=unclassified Lentimicrobium TaxID=2677434 RepID=UPI0015569703|nr:MULTISPECIES: LptF/LptG family permease [unclassified Lentimicrobium]NPD44497.1 YjgP/YjgQ family permease [Lentimicrobium sp. S6]NPD84203.1 YjgP/YjgQ family permease [Lentimicrobium sp. L6]